MKTLPVALTLMLLSGIATAHSELPAPDWCDGGRLVPVMTVDVPAHTLESRGQMCRADPQIAQTKECGQFDDDYDLAYSAAMGICHSLGFRLQSVEGDVGGVIFVPDGPSTYLDPAHHAIYRFEHGLSGICVRCEPRRVVEPPPR
jgi:hypothetical protein